MYYMYFNLICNPKHLPSRRKAPNSAEQAAVVLHVFGLNVDLLYLYIIYIQLIYIYRIHQGKVSKF